MGKVWDYDSQYLAAVKGKKMQFRLYPDRAFILYNEVVSCFPGQTPSGDDFTYTLVVKTTLDAKA